MTLTQFKYILEVEKTRSINKAANNLFVSQSVLSLAIKNLEKELGYSIFLRTNKGILPTPLGKTFLSYIRPIYEQIKNINQLVRGTEHQHIMTLSITSSGWTFLSNIMSELYQKYKSSGLRIEYYEAFGSEPENLVANGIADIGFIRRYSCYARTDKMNFKSLKLQFFPLCVGDVGVTVSPSNPLFYNESDYITPDQLQDSTPIFHAYFDAGPYSDILSRLKIPAALDRFIVTSRAAMYELLAQTNSYYINSIFFKTKGRMRHMSASSPQRTLILSGNDIKSEFGWFKREKMTLNTITMDLINMISDYFSDNFCE